MKKYIVGLLIFILPSFFLCFILRNLGYKIGRKVKIGFSFLIINNFELEDNSRIGNFNLILNDSIIFKKNAVIGYLNVFKGPFNVLLKENSKISNKNYITRGKKGVSYGEANLTLGKYSIITVSHHLDLTQSISFGNYSILAGIRSQMWTHGYYHAKKGLDRIRIDGEIKVGNNVYIGSCCVFNPGVKISDAIHIGGGSVISKDLTKEGMYVGQALRYIENNIDIVKSKLAKVDNSNLVEEVYFKN